MATRSEPLSEYNRRRDFTKTREPKGTVKRTHAGRKRFLVQKHDATRLHYDFRLEWDGVLKSWAVTRGPSLNPEDKRLAIRTEDHPLAYGDFEGTIPEGEYGGGTVMLWDTGWWEPEGDPTKGLKEGKLAFRLHGSRMKGGWALVRMRPRDGEKQESWLLVKQDDDMATEDGDSLLEDEVTSVTTGRTMDEIAEGQGERRARLWHSNKSTTAKEAKAVKLETAKPTDAAPKAAKHKPAAKTTKASSSKGDADVLGVRVSHPERILFEGQGITKIDLARYYAVVAERMLPFAADHPLSLVRCPQGGQRHCFYQKHATDGFPEAIREVPIEESSGDTENYMYVHDAKGLVAAVQMGTLEFHIWGATIGRLEKPDRLVFDLDPDPSVDFATVKTAAARLRDELAGIGLKTVAMVTGGKGVHVIVPLRPHAGWDEAKGFAKRVAQSFAERDPEHFVATMSKAKRKGRIFIDWLRNDRGATAIAPYSTRARAGGPVAMPVGWDELESLEAANTFHIADIIDRIEAGTDPWRDIGEIKQSLTKKMVNSTIS